MKKILIFVVFCIISCGNEIVEKPENLIPEDQMTAILYDLSLLDAIRAQRPLVLQQMKIKPTAYIYKKYNIDSIQFAKSNAYYAADLKVYKKMYDEVAQKLEANKTAVTPKSNSARQTAPNTPQIQ